MRFLVDECVAGQIVIGLRKQGFDVVSVAERAPGMSDVDVLKWAEREVRVLVTEDYDFGHLAFRRKLAAHAIVIIGPGVFRGDEDAADPIADRITRLADALAGRLTILERLRTRQRDLL